MQLDRDRKRQVQLIKQICKYPLSITKKRLTYSKRRDNTLSPREERLSGYEEYFSKLDALSISEQREFSKKFNKPNKNYFENFKRESSKEDEELFSSRHQDGQYQFSTYR